MERKFLLLYSIIVEHMNDLIETLFEISGRPLQKVANTPYRWTAWHLQGDMLSCRYRTSLFCRVENACGFCTKKGIWVYSTNDNVSWSILNTFKKLFSVFYQRYQPYDGMSVELNSTNQCVIYLPILQIFLARTWIASHFFRLV